MKRKLHTPPPPSRRSGPLGFTLIEHERSKSVRRNESFTLIELLVVVAVIGLLVSIALVAFGPARKKARDAKGESEIKQIMNAFELEYSDNRVYPDLPDGTAFITANDHRLAPYLDPVPYTDGIRTYSWYDVGNNQQFCVYFNLEADPSKYFGCSQQGCKIDTSATNACGF